MAVRTLRVCVVPVQIWVPRPIQTNYKNSAIFKKNNFRVYIGVFFELGLGKSAFLFVCSLSGRIDNAGIACARGVC